MALEGNLTAFGLSEILQLIAVQQKTGMLTVTNVESNTVMFFRNGELISTRDRRRKARDAFKEYVTRYGVLDHADLVRISQISSQSKLDFIDILTSEGFLEPAELLRHWRKQMQETMHDVLTWEEGTYKFVSGKELVDGIKSPGSFSVEGMLMESMRRIDEFPQMLEMFPNDRLIFSRRGTGADTDIDSDGGTDGGTDGDLGDNASDDDLTDIESTILGLIDRATTLRDLIARGKMPLFEVYEALKCLREKNLVDMEEPEPEGESADEDTGSTARSRRAIKNVFPLLAAIALFTAAMYVGFGDTVAALSPQKLEALEPMSGHAAERARVEHRLRWLIEGYRAENGVYPANLGTLADSGLASPAFMRTVRDHEFRYRLTTGRTGYTLL
ncbi:MAG: DUF4388 domain-containing protein [Gemmatimonadales bacterium]|jgi:hypothetical protein